MSPLFAILVIALTCHCWWPPLFSIPMLISPAILLFQLALHQDSAYPDKKFFLRVSLCWACLGLFLSLHPSAKGVLLDRGWHYALAVAPFAAVYSLFSNARTNSSPGSSKAVLRKADDLRRIATWLCLQFSLCLSIFFWTFLSVCAWWLLAWLACTCVASLFLLARLLMAKPMAPYTVFVSFSDSDPRTRAAAEVLLAELRRVGIDPFDFRLHPVDSSVDSTTQIQKNIADAVRCSDCTCEIITNEFILHEWKQYEAHVIRESRLPRFFVILDSDFLHARSLAASGQIIRLNFTDGRVAAVEGPRDLVWTAGGQLVSAGCLDTRYMHSGLFRARCSRLARHLRYGIVNDAWLKVSIQLKPDGLSI